MRNIIEKRLFIGRNKSAAQVNSENARRQALACCRWNEIVKLFMRLWESLVHRMASLLCRCVIYSLFSFRISREIWFGRHLSFNVIDFQRILNCTHTFIMPLDSKDLPSRYFAVINNCNYWTSLVKPDDRRRSMKIPQREFKRQAHSWYISKRKHSNHWNSYWVHSINAWTQYPASHLAMHIVSRNSARLSGGAHSLISFATGRERYHCINTTPSAIITQ